MTEFEKCVNIKRIKNRVSINCKLGEWGVSAPNDLEAFNEAKWYFQQYKEDGTYHEIIGGESPLDKMLKRRNKND